MSDEPARFEAVRAAGRRLDAAVAAPLSRAGAVPRNGAAQGGWLRTLFGGAGAAHAESATDRAAYLLLCQSVVASHVIDRATTAAFPRSDGAAYAVRDAALAGDAGPGLRNTARAGAQDLRKVRNHRRSRTGVVATLLNSLR